MGPQFCPDPSITRQRKNDIILHDKQDVTFFISSAVGTIRRVSMYLFYSYIVALEAWGLDKPSIVETALKEWWTEWYCGVLPLQGNYWQYFSWFDKILEEVLDVSWVWMWYIVKPEVTSRWKRGVTDLYCVCLWNSKVSYSFLVK